MVEEIVEDLRETVETLLQVCEAQNNTIYMLAYRIANLNTRLTRLETGGDDEENAKTQINAKQNL